ncbi:hypothetical protein, partial [Pseudomonas poae]|uniref:hypothetical protein n=1 Tax=Pseudomonas poae TaxID=200451 RepID=UPI001F440893
GLYFEFGENHKFQHIDHSSVIVITRAAIEAFLTLHYVFINNDVNLSIFRHKTWQLAGLMDRSRMFAGSPEAKEILKLEAKEIEILKNEIHVSPFYKNGNNAFRKK